MFLTIASFVFYGWWDWRFLFLLIASGLLDFFVALAMEKTVKYRTYLLMLSTIGNLGALFVFKYSAFVAGNIEMLAAYFGVTLDLVSKIPEFTLILPVGISFYTFQSMSYTIDVYRR